MFIMVLSSKESFVVSEPSAVQIYLESLEFLFLPVSSLLETSSSKVDPCSLLLEGFPISSTSMGTFEVLENSSQ